MTVIIRRVMTVIKRMRRVVDFWSEGVASGFS